jgi:hypothetical protein
MEGHDISLQCNLTVFLTYDIRSRDNFYINVLTLFCCFCTVPPSSLNIESVISQNNRLKGTEGQDLPVSCKAEGGKPAPNVVLIIDGQSLANQIQLVQHILTTISRSYDHKTVTCQASNPAYSKISLNVSALIYLNCK